MKHKLFRFQVSILMLFIVTLGFAIWLSLLLYLEQREQRVQYDARRVVCEYGGSVTSEIGDELRLLGVNDFRVTKVEFLNDSFDDNGLLIVCRATSIEEIDLRFTKVSDVGCVSLHQLSHLKVLKLDGSSVTDSTLRCLPTSLEVLDLGDFTGVDSIPAIGKLKNLKELYVDFGSFSVDELMEIQSRIPNVIVKQRDESGGRGNFE